VTAFTSAWPTTWACPNTRRRWPRLRRDKDLSKCSKHVTVPLPRVTGPNSRSDLQRTGGQGSTRSDDPSTARPGQGAERAWASASGPAPHPRFYMRGKLVIQRFPRERCRRSFNAARFRAWASSGLQRGLDVMAVLGSKRDRSHRQGWRDTYPARGHGVYAGACRFDTDWQPEPTRTGTANLYWSWLHAPSSAHG